MAQDPFTAHLELARATKDAIHACERYFHSRDGEMPSPEAMAMLQAVARLRRTHEQFGHFAGGMILAHQALAEAYQIDPAAVPTVIPPGADTPWLHQGDAGDEGDFDGDDDDADDAANPRDELLTLAVPATVVDLDGLAQVATEVVGVDGTAIALLFGHWNDEAAAGAPVFRLTPAERDLLTRLAVNFPVLRAVVGAIADVVVLAVHPGRVAQDPDAATEGFVTLDSAEAVDALASLPEFKVARRVAPREVLLGVVDAVRAAIGGAAFPVTVRLADPFASILADALAALRAAQVDQSMVGPLLDGVRVTPAP